MLRMEAIVIDNRSIPRVTVIPELGYPDVNAAVDWLCATFGFTLRVRIGGHRAQLNVGDGALVVIQSNDAPRAHSVMVRVEDVNAHHAHTVSRGARVLSAPTDHPYGERQYAVEDFIGRRWKFSQSIADVAPEEWGGTSV
jgi:uncharacterized glyoxalase superfamily protein PhnB